MVEIDFEQKFPIDRMALDVEWETQHELFRHYASKLAEEQVNLDGWKDHLERTRAELDKEIRKGYDVAGKKCTEAMVTADILLHPDYQSAQAGMRECQSEFLQLKADVSALEQRKVALENLVRLFGQEYYAQPSLTDKEREQYKVAKGKDASRKALNK